MSTLIFRFEGDGHKPRVSPKGNLVAWGNTFLRVVDVANPAAIWPVGEGRALRFLDNDHITWVKPTSNFTANLYHDDLRFFSGGIKDEIADPSLVAGNDFDASNGHWASVLVSQNRLTYDYTRRSSIASAVRMSGDYMLVVEEIKGSRYFVVYHQGLLSKIRPIPANANEFLISEQGWITYGYFG